MLVFVLGFGKISNDPALQVYLDGGLSNNQPVLDDRTIRVNPLASNAHIAPRDSNNSSSNKHLGEAVRTIRKAGVDLELSVENARRVWRATTPLADMDYLHDEGFRRMDEFIGGADFAAFRRS